MGESHFSHLPGHISGEVAVRSELQVAAVSGGVVHQVDLPWLEDSERNKEHGRVCDQL